MHRTSLYFFNNTVTMNIAICVLLVLSSLLNAAFGCSWMERYSDLSNQSLSLICQMGGPITKEEGPVRFPYKLYKSMQNFAEPETKMIFIREGLEMILNLYSCDNCSSDSWDADKTRHFLTIIHRQVTELNGCVPIEKRNKQLQKHFRRLKNRTLKQTGNNTASWELIRSDTRYHLVQLQLLANSIARPSQDHQLHSTASATTQNN